MKEMGMRMNTKVGAVKDAKKGQPPWWLSIPETFSKDLHVTDIDVNHKLKVKGSAAVDGVLRIGLASAVLAAMTPNLLISSRMKKDLHHLEFYGDFVDRRDPEAVFAKPQTNVKIKRERVPYSRYLPKDAIVELLSTESTYQTLNPEIRAEYAKLHHNIPAVAQHWRHADGPRPTLIFTHGFFADAPWFNSMMFSLRWFFKQGYDILLHTLPFHGLRRRKADFYSGLGFFSHGYAFMNEAFLQGVYDLRVWMDYLEEQGVTAMGASGYSLGGYTTALVASADKRLKFAIPNAPAVLLIDMIKGWSPINLGMAYMMKKNGLSLTDLRYMTAIHCSLTWQPVISADRLMVIGGAGDRFTSPQFVNALHQHWVGSEMHWFPGNHLMHLHQPSYLRIMKKFMDKACAV
jgi:pimeloyl-ACP methyl ester carboxylesterase